MSMKDKEAFRIQSKINRVRTVLLLLSDKDMTYKIKHPTCQINSEFPKMIDYCKENNFYLTIQQNFCSSRVTYSEENLKKAQIALRSDSQKIMNGLERHKNEKNSWFNGFRKSLLHMKKSINNGKIIQPHVMFAEMESPTVSSIRKIRKKIVTKKSVVCLPKIVSNVTKTENLKRNKAGQYLDDPLVMQKICMSFKYIRNLPAINKDYAIRSSAKSPEIKRLEEEELDKQVEELEDLILIKDGLDLEEENVQKKLSKMRFKVKEMELGKPVSKFGKLRPIKFIKSKKSLKIDSPKGNVRNLEDPPKETIKVKSKKSSTHLLCVGMFNTLTLFSPEKKKSTIEEKKLSNLEEADGELFNLDFDDTIKSENSNKSNDGLNLNLNDYHPYNYDVFKLDSNLKQCLINYNQSNKKGNQDFDILNNSIC